jgi:hypothetical protein
MRHTDKTATLRFSRAALSCALGLSIVLAAAPVRAADDDDNVPLDTKLIQKLMSGLGLKRDGESDGIDYRERAPLVIPPARMLPPPEQADAAVANNPAWPVDPDIKRKKEAKAAERKSRVNADQQLLRDQSALRPDEMMPGPRPRDMPASSPPGSSDVSPNGNGSQLSPSKLGYNGGLWKKMFGKDDDEVGKFTGEPARASLTAPPAGYQTPSPDQPYGVGKTKAKAETSGDYLLNHPVGSN